MSEIFIPPVKLLHEITLNVLLGTSFLFYRSLLPTVKACMFVYSCRHSVLDS